MYIYAYGIRAYAHTITKPANWLSVHTDFRTIYNRNIIVYEEKEVILNVILCV